MTKKLNWLGGGFLLGAVFLAAVWLVKPVGVSTQFVIVDGIAWNMFSSDLITEKADQSGYESNNDYLNKSGGKYAKNVAKPLNYGLLFVISMIAGGFVSGYFSKQKVSSNERIFPKVWQERFGSSASKRYLFAFLAGFLALFGARLAGGCTSGHMMSGMMQTSLSGYLFAFGAFAIAIPVAILFYKSKKQ